MDSFEKKQDGDLRKLFEGLKIEAGENLKYRIMQQIETESVFVKKRVEVKSPIPIVKNVLTVFGVMYGLIVLVVAAAWFYGGQETLLSPTLFTPVIGIAFICGMLALISVFDDYRRAARQLRKKRNAEQSGTNRLIVQ